MSNRTIAHISYGVVPTGGYRHEQSLMNSIVSYFAMNKMDTQEKTIRYPRLFEGLSNLKLLWNGYRDTTSDVSIVVSRIALSALMRNLFTKKKILIVLHYFDERDKKGLLLKWYYKWLFFILRVTHSRNVGVVTVAPFWVKYFEEKCEHNIPVFLFPNLLNSEFYIQFKGVKKLKQIHLGQFSWKNDTRIFSLAKELSLLGYFCYFSTMLKSEAGKFDGYDVLFEDYETYLRHMAESEYTLAFSGVNEGWNRVAHESILVGTSVIGTDVGGLGDLLRESGSAIVKKPEELLEIIKAGINYETQTAFVEHYDISNAIKYIQPIGEFLSR